MTMRWNRAVLAAVIGVALSAAAPRAGAQRGPEVPPQPPVPAPGVTLHMQLVEADTSIKTRDPAIMDMARVSAGMTQCPRPWDSREKPPACGTKAPLGYVLLDEQTVTTDAQGHAVQRFSLRDGQAVAEIDISDLHVVGQASRVWMRAGFWPKVERGEAPVGNAAMRATLPVSMGHIVDMMLAYPTGGLILLVRPELPPQNPSR